MLFVVGVFLRVSCEHFFPFLYTVTPRHEKKKVGKRWWWSQINRPFVRETQTTWDVGLKDETAAFQANRHIYTFFLFFVRLTSCVSRHHLSRLLVLLTYIFFTSWSYFWDSSCVSLDNNREQRRRHTSQVFCSSFLSLVETNKYSPYKFYRNQVSSFVRNTQLRQQEWEVSSWWWRESLFV